MWEGEAEEPRDGRDYPPSAPGAAGNGLLADGALRRAVSDFGFHLTLNPLAPGVRNSG
jgi:hypothetical protein